MTSITYLFPRVTITFLGAVLTVACAQQHNQAPSLPVAAVVDEVAISQKELTVAIPEDDLTRRVTQLDAFVSEQLMASAAIKAKLDEDPAVVATLATARRQILARAYLREKSMALAKPTADQITSYYTAHPELFEQRHIYRLQEIAIKGSSAQIAQIEQQLQAAKTFNERAAALQKMAIPFTTGVVVKPAEEIPADLLKTLNKLQDGDAFTLPNSGGAAFMQITGIESHPISRVQAQALIERYLTNERLGEIIIQESKQLHDVAKISYVAPYSSPTH